MKALPISSTERKHGCPWLTFGLRQNWQMFVFYAVMLFLPCIMVTVSGIADASDKLHSVYLGISPTMAGEYLDYNAREFGADVFLNLALAFAVVSCFVGVFAGMAAGSYVNSRRAVHCYHSLPLTRDQLYLQNGAIHGIYYLTAGLFSLVVSTVAILVRLGMAGDAVGRGIWVIFTGIFACLVVFSLFQLAGSLTGTAVFRFCLAGIIAFLPIVVYLLLYLGVQIGMPHLDEDAYFYNTTVMRALCPAVNILFTLEEMGSVVLQTGKAVGLGRRLLCLFGLLLTAAVYFTGGLLCHRKRPSERSENALLWKKLGIVVKYPVIFVCAAFGGLLFREIFGTGTSWMVFGAIIGLILSFFLMNVLLERNTRSLFRGLRGLGVTALCAALFYAVFPFDVLSLDTYMYQPDAVGYILLEDVPVTDPDQVRQVTEAIRRQIELEKEGGLADLSLSYTGYDTERIPYDPGDVPTYYIDSSKVIGQTRTQAEALLDRYFLSRYVPELGDNPRMYYWTGGEAYTTSGKFNDGVNYVREQTTAAMEPIATVAAAVETKLADKYGEGSYGGDMMPGSDRVNISVYPKFGLPVHRYIRIPALSSDQSILDVKKANDVRGDKVDFLLEKAADVTAIYHVELSVLDWRMDLDIDWDIAERDPAAAEKCDIAAYEEALQRLLTAAAHVPEGAERTMCLGRLWISGTHTTSDEKYARTYDLYAGMTDFWQAFGDLAALLPDFVDNALGELDIGYGVKEFVDMLTFTRVRLYDDPAAILDWLAERYAHAWVIEAETGRSLYVTGEDMANLLAGCLLEEYSGDVGTRDSGYMVTYVCYTEDALRKGSHVDFPDQADTTYGNTWFRLGDVPGFVTEAFGQR